MPRTVVTKSVGDLYLKNQLPSKRYERSDRMLLAVPGLPARNKKLLVTRAFLLGARTLPGRHSEPRSNRSDWVIPQVGAGRRSEGSERTSNSRT